MGTATVILTGDAAAGLDPGSPHLRALVPTLPVAAFLGRNRPVARPAALRLEDFVGELAAGLPEIPVNVDWYTRAAASLARMYRNNVQGCCVISGKLHSLGVWSANDPDSGGEVQATDAEVDQQYHDICGPGDNGCYIPNVLNVFRDKGLRAGGRLYKIDGYVTCDWRSKELTQIGLALFGAATIGVNLPASWTSSSVWEPTESRIVGGHDVTPCFTGDTKVPLLDGTELTMKELADGAAGKSFWVYSCDGAGNVVPGKAHSARKTGESRDLVCVTLDNGERIRCTPGHRFLLRDGTYREARELQSGDSLMPLYRKLGTGGMRGYERVYNPATKKWRYTHRESAAFAHGGRYTGDVVHHRDFNKRNNSPDNLEVMSWGEHTRLHAEDVRLLNEYAKSEYGRGKSRELMSRLWADPQWLARMVKQLGENGRAACNRRAAEGRNGFQAWTPEDRKRSAAKAGKKLRGRKQPPHVVAALHGGLGRWRDTDEGQVAVKAHQAKATEAAAKKHAERGTTDAQREARRRNMLALRARKAANNHKVVSVEPAGREDVYDMTVDVHHNFALSAGVFVHNCGYGDAVMGTGKDGVVISSWGRLYLITWPAWQSSRWLEEFYFMVPSFVWTGADKVAPSRVNLAELRSALDLLKQGRLPPLPPPIAPPPPPPVTAGAWGEGCAGGGRAVWRGRDPSRPVTVTPFPGFAGPLSVACSPDRQRVVVSSGPGYVPRAMIYDWAGKPIAGPFAVFSDNWKGGTSCSVSGGLIHFTAQNGGGTILTEFTWDGGYRGSRNEPGFPDGLRTGLTCFVVGDPNLGNLAVTGVRNYPASALPDPGDFSASAPLPTTATFADFLEAIELVRAAVDAERVAHDLTKARVDRANDIFARLRGELPGMSGPDVAAARGAFEAAIDRLTELAAPRGSAAGPPPDPLPDPTGDDPMPGQFDDLIKRFGDATDAVAERIRKDAETIKTSMTQAEVDDAKARFGVVADHLEAIGRDPNNPTPPLPPDTP